MSFRRCNVTPMVRSRVFLSALPSVPASTSCVEPSRISAVLAFNKMQLPFKLFNLNDPGWGRGNQGQGGSGDEPPRRPPRGGQNQGPPDLDELWRDFNKRLSGLFGRRPRRNNPFGGGSDGGGGGGQSPRSTRMGIIVVVVAAVLIWLGSGFFIIQEGNVGVVTRFGEYKTTVPAGFQWHIPTPVED